MLTLRRVPRENLVLRSRIAFQQSLTDTGSFGENKGPEHLVWSWDVLGLINTEHQTSRCFWQVMIIVCVCVCVCVQTCALAGIWSPFGPPQPCDSFSADLTSWQCVIRSNHLGNITWGQIHLYYLLNPNHMQCAYDCTRGDCIKHDAYSCAHNLHNILLPPAGSARKQCLIIPISLTLCTLVS